MGFVTLSFSFLFFLLLRLIEHNDQKIAPYCKSIIKAPEVVLLAKIHHVQQVLLTALAPVPVKFLLISSHHCSLALFSLSLCPSQQWKSLFDKVCSASHSGFSHSPSACFTHCGGALSSGVLICVWTVVDLRHNPCSQPTLMQMCRGAETLDCSAKRLWGMRNMFIYVRCIQM